MPGKQPRMRTPPTDQSAGGINPYLLGTLDTLGNIDRTRDTAELARMAAPKTYGTAANAIRGAGQAILNPLMNRTGQAIVKYAPTVARAGQTVARVGSQATKATPGLATLGKMVPRTLSSGLGPGGMLAMDAGMIGLEGAITGSNPLSYENLVNPQNPYSYLNSVKPTGGVADFGFKTVDAATQPLRSLVAYNRMGIDDVYRNYNAPAPHYDRVTDGTRTWNQWFKENAQGAEENMKMFPIAGETASYLSKALRRNALGHRF